MTIPKNYPASNNVLFVDDEREHYLDMFLRARRVAEHMFIEELHGTSEIEHPRGILDNPTISMNLE